MRLLKSNEIVEDIIIESIDLPSRCLTNSMLATGPIQDAVSADKLFSNTCWKVINSGGLNSRYSSH
jgi:hypothetical protein